MSFDGSEGVSFHTFTLPEIRCVRLLVKNLVVLCLRASSERSSSSWIFISRESSSSHLVLEIRTHRRTALPPLTSSCQWGDSQSCQTCVHSPKSVACDCRCKRTWLQKARCNPSAASASDTRSETADMHPVRRVWGSHISGGCSTPREQRQCCGCGGKQDEIQKLC
jgi:hypothetical protein